MELGFWPKLNVILFSSKILKHIKYACWIFLAIGKEKKILLKGIWPILLVRKTKRGRGTLLSSELSKISCDKVQEEIVKDQHRKSEPCETMNSGLRFWVVRAQDLGEGMGYEY